MTTPEDAVARHSPHIQVLLEEAVKRGAQAAFREMGLDGPNAAQDIRDMRRLLEDFRAIRRAIMDGIVKAILAAILAAVAIGFGKGYLVGK